MTPKSFVRGTFAVLALASATTSLVACSKTNAAGKPIPTIPGKRCVLKLHGKSGNGGPAETRGDVTYLRPTGNAEGWGGRQWIYFPDDEYRVVQKTVSDTLAASGCDNVVLEGFSNGAAAAAKLYCRGETFGGHVVGYVIDDPVVDHGVDGCKPPANTKVKLYWTGGLAQAVEGWNCKDADWTCEGGNAIGIQKYAAALGTEVTPSPNKKHEEYQDPPEYSSWWPAPK